MRRARFMLLIFCSAVLPAVGQTWRPLGPPGGDVRSLAADPNDARQIYLGTSDGHIFGSRDAGKTWQRLGRAASRPDAVVTAILVDPRVGRILYAAIWTQNPGAGGGVYRSADSGYTWQPVGLTGQAVRALAQAPSQPDVLVAGTLVGVYRSIDAGKSWTCISPEGHPEIRNLDAVAIDPHNPDIIYAGTFHLPWKTLDAGRHWFPINAGMIDDSDVMSILVDGTNAQRIYASACSGIYRSENGGALWKKIQGIPFSARRTHVIRQGPHRPATIYAGTTEGLWKTTTAGAKWRQVTSANWVITALIVLRENPDRLLVGTEGLGVLVSDDGGENFRATNSGFFHRQIVALALDSHRPGHLLALLANAPEPVLSSPDGGQTWTPLGAGLGSEKLRGLYASPKGWWAALARGGLMHYDEQQGKWLKTGSVTEASASPQASRARLRHVVNDMAFGQQGWFAATDQGLFASRDRGATWFRFPVGPLPTLPVRSVRLSSDGQKIWVVSLRGMVFSRDAGRTWTWHDPPVDAGGALRLEVSSHEDGEALVVIARNGLYISRDASQSWEQAGSGLPASPVLDLAVVGSTFLASMRTGGAYISYDRGRTWARLEGVPSDDDLPVMMVEDSSATIFAASATDGLYALQLPVPSTFSSVREGKTK